MSRYARDLAYDDYKPHSYQSDRNGRPYEDQYRGSYARDRYRRSPSPRARYSSPSSHDRNRNSNGGDDFVIKGASTRRERLTPPLRNDTRALDDHRPAHSPSPRRRNTGGYRDRDREGYRSPGYDPRSRSRIRSQSRSRSRSRSRSHSRSRYPRSPSRSRSRSPRRVRSPYYGGPPSREVILEGLMLDMVEDDISKELKQYHHVERLDDVRVIRDRQTKVSRGFGFIRFPTLEGSKAFVERNYPTIYLYGNSTSNNDDQAAKVRIAFSRERDDRPRNDKSDGEWTCKICTFINFPGRVKCHRCQAPQIAAYGQSQASKPQFMNSGDSDISPNGAPSQFLLIRGLEPTVSEDLLAKGIAKLYKPSRRTPPPANAPSKKGGAKVASTTGDANLGAREASLRRILLVRDRRNNESWRYGFAEFATIDDAQAALVRYNSFEKFTIASKPVTADYIHAGVFVPALNATEETKRFTFSPLGNTTTKLAYWDEEAWVSELVVSSGSPKLGSAANEGQVRSVADQAAAAAENEGLLKPGQEGEGKAKKRKAEASASTKQKKTAPAHLQFWSNRHAELHGVKPDGSGEVKVETEETSGKSGTSTVKDPPPRSYADPTKKCCYLCSRQFKTEAEVNKHERLSDLHRDNLKNEDLVLKAQTKMAKAGFAPSTSVEDNPEYRDRAKERRAAFGGTKKISLPLKKSMSKGEEEPRDELATAPSKGASLLGKMGWSAGEGLGAQGTGMTAPIATDMYVQGVGLGAQGGKLGDAADEAERNTKSSYSEFLERTKDKAKERFEKLG